MGYLKTTDSQTLQPVSHLAAPWLLRDVSDEYFFPVNVTQRSCQVPCQHPCGENDCTLVFVEVVSRVFGEEPVQLIYLEVD